MKCHYEVLGITRTAEGDEIKKSYRKLALRWHPDKNLDNAEEANQQFLLVQAAYDVLSDPQERAWYDNHREQIIRGGHTDYEDSSLDVFQYFTTSCYKGFGDEAGGFYAVYAEVFDKLATEEVEFLDTEEEFETIPKFGNSQSDYETIVRIFYGYWEGFCTKKSYAWLNPHNVAEIRDRRILKAIEKDNKKVQQKARKERNEEIRSLVMFVKKRDKRVQAYKKLLEERATQNRLKSEQNRLEQIRRNQQEIEEQQRNSTSFFNDAYEEQLKKLEASYAEASEEESVEEDEQTNGLEDAMAGLNVSQNENGEESFYVDDLYCVACDKMFSNRSSYENHESSKKHKQNVELLRKEMRKEMEANEGGEAELENGYLSNEELQTYCEEEEELDEKPEIQPTKTKQRKNKGKKKALSTTMTVIKSSDDEENDAAADGVDMIGLRLAGPSSNAPASDDDDDWTGGSKKSTRKGKAKGKGSEWNQKPKPSKTVKNEVPQVNWDAEASTSKATQESKLAISDDESAGHPSDQACVTCKEKFTSNNKLFEHLKKTGHSVYIDKLKATKTAAKGAEGSKGKRKGK
ncbi:dnaJ homolog subfamily C member 21 [Anopheles marshallii]|uniref:dnaJ homolog subfamily C member 21 n=1 Tax=Anopheles marshallii TaxID=1521116 RepID=UPI00237A4E3C|nr:dnaJ homolog subfamily C member 21 [Anopheles marshallii]